MSWCEVLWWCIPWLKESSYYSFAQKKKNINKFWFYGIVSTVMLLLMYFGYDSKSPKYIASSYNSMNIYLWFDIWFYLIRYWCLKKSYSEPHIFLLVHSIVHISLSFFFFEALFYIGYGPDKKREDVANYMTIYILLLLRTFVYLIVIVVLIITWPWILYSHFVKARMRRQYYQSVSLLRRSSIHSMRNYEELPPQDDIFNYIPNDDPAPVQNQNQNQNQLRPEDLRMLEAILNGEYRQRQDNFGDLFMNLLNNNYNNPPPINTYDRLRRVKYNDVREKLDYFEWSIWIFPFDENPDEDLIYLPWDRKHIFHAEWIIEWLKRDSSCPLCKAPVNAETVERYHN